MAPPRLCPVTITRLFGCEAAAVFRAASTPGRASTQLSQKPSCAVQEGQMSVGSAGKLIFVIQLRTELEPRKANTVSALVLSMAT